LSSDPVGAEFLYQVRNAVLDGSAYQGVPASHLWRVLGRAPDIPSTPIFFDYLIAPRSDGPASSRCAEVEIRRVPISALIPIRTSARLLDLVVVDRHDEIELRLYFDAAVFPVTAMNGLQKHWLAIANRLSHNAETRVSRICVEAEP
jgi:hypothetical protein